MAPLWLVAPVCWCSNLVRTSECPFLAPESLLGCGISLGGPLFQSELSAEVPARPQSPPESLKCLSRWPNATTTLVPPHVSLSCPQMFSSPSGPSFIIEARKKFNLGTHLHSQEIAFAYSRWQNHLPPLTFLASHSGNISLCLTFSAISFSHLCFSYFLDCPLLTWRLLPVCSRCFVFPIEGVFPPPPPWWMTSETSDPLPIWGPLWDWAGPCLSLHYLHRGRCFLLHRVLFSFPGKPGLGDGSGGTSDRDA